MSSALEKGQNDGSDLNLSSDEHSPERRALEKRLLRKIDLRMSILVVIYILNYIDRNNAAAARNRGLVTDLKLKGQEYPTLLSILYVGCRPSLYLPGAMIVWGVISALTVFLGFVEAAFFPGALFLLSKWYKRDEIGLRTAILYCGNIISNAFGSLMASGILANMQGKLGHAAWRWLFYIGSTHSLHCRLRHLYSSRFPGHIEMAVARRKGAGLLRMTEDAGVGDQNETEQGGPFHGLFLALTDWRVWWLAFALTAQVVALSFNAFFPTLTATLGFSPTVTLLLCAPPFAIAALAAFLLARSVGERCFHMISSFGLGVLGFVIAISTMNTAARYISLFLMAQSYAGFVVMYTWMSNSFPRPPSKRAVALALMNAFSQLGNIAGSYVWPSTWGPTYRHSYAICIACSGTTIVMCLLFRWSLIIANRQLDKEEEEQGVKTKGYRYIL
ncbi:MFS general substrate transporter [Mycena metata]|uniref:MFS general substrate transporter n=1 Tax=Mycena metata TaxID=1033252 RepID=A0AAD7KA07_9AGAR|nr:MFS general substrate transporter [Mycena metata]